MDRKWASMAHYAEMFGDKADHASYVAASI
jgi:hypothetical protein